MVTMQEANLLQELSQDICLIDDKHFGIPVAILKSVLRDEEHCRMLQISRSNLRTVCVNPLKIKQQRFS